MINHGTEIFSDFGARRMNRDVLVTADYFLANSSIYGLKQAPRLWYDRVRDLKSFRDGTTIDLSIHVDDGLATSDNMEELNN